MKRIYKYPLEIHRKQTLTLPKGAKILSIQAQNNIPVMWALVDPEAETEDIFIELYGTGHDIPESDGLKYLGTSIHDGGSLIWHFFKRKQIMKGQGNIVAGLQYLRLAEENFISFIAEYPGSKGARLFEGYLQKLRWIYRDMVTNPNFDQSVRDGIKEELEADVLAVPEIYNKIAMIPPSLREPVEFVIERILAGEELHVEHINADQNEQ